MSIKNAGRFTGFADVYDEARPHMPLYPVQVICRYLGKNPETVVDLGCGTGLSTEVWQSVCENITGVEPSGDMLEIANKKANASMKFIRAFSDNTGLPNDFADVVICSQSFHWMEPCATLAEVNRILKKGGIFATVDCDWPPVTKWQAEKAYMKLYEKVKEIEALTPEIKETFVRYPKDKHLKNIAQSGYFGYSRELLFSNTEKCTKERFEKIILSQGSFQTVYKKRPELIENELEEFRKSLDGIFDNSEFEIEFCYRMRIGIK